MRRDNIAMFQDTMEILNQGYYKIGDESRKLKLTREQMEAARVFLPEDIEAISFPGRRILDVSACWEDADTAV